MPCERYIGWSGSAADESFSVELNNCYCFLVFDDSERASSFVGCLESSAT